MGSTEEMTKVRSAVKKKMDRESSDESESKSPTDKLSDSDSAKTPEEPGSPQKLVGAMSLAIPNARSRQDSDSSSDEGKSPSSDRMKRQRTISGSSPVQSFIFPGVAASPPKFMSLEEVMKATDGVSNMVLAHEIAVDKNFKLEKFDPPENSMEKQVRDVMHKAFWDHLREQLRQDPPSFEQALVLIQEVRDNLLDITLSHQTRLRQDITETMDLDLIKQQAEHGSLDFKQYSQYVLSIMAKLCAPIRDETIQNLGKESDVIEVFRGVMETLDLMRLDMANFAIQQIRPHIIAQSVEYEKDKFAEFLKTQNDGLELTRVWLVENIGESEMEVTDDFAVRRVVGKVISKAYLQLLSWPEDRILAETVVLDGSRFLELRDRLLQVCILGTTMLITLSSVGPLIKKPDEFKIKLKRNICIILDPALSEKETMDLMENIAEQIVKEVDDHLTETDRPPLPQSARSALKVQIMEAKSPDHRIRTLINKRALEFISTLISSTTSQPVQMPPGLSTLQEELKHICGTFMRLISHNRAVFGDYYADIITQYIKAGQEMKKEEEPGQEMKKEEEPGQEMKKEEEPKD
ncbi:T-complex protein 11-like protein 1 isoform X2 [Oratosquilla oratoria]|uniref:T-complex protein 11-like protein 1 isoform X2 n=1 Tax=Oratosquilla oratoria TaxID=337810 RepID=UPI003F769A5A